MFLCCGENFPGKFKLFLFKWVENLNVIFWLNLNLSFMLIVVFTFLIELNNLHYLK